MQGDSAQWGRYVGLERPNDTHAALDLRRPTPRRADDAGQPLARRGARKKLKETGVYRRRRILAVSVVMLSVLALVLAAFAQVPGVKDQALPIDPNNAGPDVVLAEAAGVGISSPIRPEELRGLGYHPEGESLVEMSPRGKNLSRNPVLGLFASDSTPEKIQYHLMDPASRQGSHTGSLDVGAEAKTAVYAPVSGTVTAIRPDPVLQEGAKVVEIKPVENPDLRISVSLVQEIEGEIGPKSPVAAGMTRLGSVADMGEVLKPQLASYTSDAGNHVSVSASKVN